MRVDLKKSLSAKAKIIFFASSVDLKKKGKGFTCWNQIYFLCIVSWSPTIKNQKNKILVPNTCHASYFFSFSGMLFEIELNLSKSQNVHKICPLQFKENHCKFAQPNFAT